MQNIVVKEPRKPAHKLNVHEGQLTLELLQRLVGGYIEVVHPDGFPQDVVLICNDDGKLNKMKFNFFVNICQYPDAICGTAVFCAEGIVDGKPDLVPLTYSQAESVARALRSTI
jgi:hypothetical protein